MRYLITANNFPPFLTGWYDFENHYNSEVNMIVYDLQKKRYSVDGETWKDIKLDHL